MTQFDSLGLSEPLLRAIREEGYETPSPVQQQAIPLVLSGRDVLAAAQTGTGKTAGFTLPLLHRLSLTPRAATPAPARSRRGHAPASPPPPVRALVLTPTRELAAQVQDSVQTYGRYLPLRSAVVFGGVGIHPQIQQLQRGVDVLVATPGRLLDLHSQQAVNLGQIEILVLDEADRMLDMGFIHDIRRVLKLLPERRQNLLFSATFSPDVLRLTEGLLHDPARVQVAAENAPIDLVEQIAYAVSKGDKPRALAHLIHRGDWHQVLVFTRTKHGANQLTKRLEREGITASAIHGNKSQSARTKALADFKANQVRALVATDIAARGLDIEQLPHVVNYELPNVPEDYVHRIGRTGRAGQTGEAISLVCADERPLLRDIERLTRRDVPLGAVPEFLPESEDKATPGGLPKPGQRGRQGQNNRGGERRAPRGDRPNGGQPQGNRGGGKPQGGAKPATGAGAGAGAGTGGGRSRRRRRKPPTSPH